MSMAAPASAHCAPPSSIPSAWSGSVESYEAYRDGILTDDDEVAVLHGPEELGYPAVTEAMVNIRATLDKAVAEGVLDQALGDRVIEIAKSLVYKDRSWDAILSIAARELSPMARASGTWPPTGVVDQKRADAAALVSAISRHLSAGPSPLTVSYRFHATGYHRAAASGSV